MAKTLTFEEYMKKKNRVEVNNQIIKVETANGVYSSFRDKRLNNPSYKYVPNNNMQSLLDEDSIFEQMSEEELMQEIIKIAESIPDDDEEIF